MEKQQQQRVGGPSAPSTSTQQQQNEEGAGGQRRRLSPRRTTSSSSLSSLHALVDTSFLVKEKYLKTVSLLGANTAARAATGDRDDDDDEFPLNKAEWGRKRCRFPFVSLSDPNTLIEGKDFFLRESDMTSASTQKKNNTANRSSRRRHEENGGTYPLGFAFWDATEESIRKEKLRSLMSKHSPDYMFWFHVYPREVLQRTVQGFYLPVGPFGNVGFSLQVSAKDDKGYKARLQRFLSQHNPEAVSHMDRILGKVSEVDIFSRLRRRYAVEDYDLRIKNFFQAYDIVSFEGNARRNKADSTTGDEGEEDEDEDDDPELILEDAVGILLEAGWEGKEEDLLRRLVVQFGFEPCEEIERLVCPPSAHAEEEEGEEVSTNRSVGDGDSVVSAAPPHRETESPVVVADEIHDVEAGQQPQEPVAEERPVPVAAQEPPAADEEKEKESQEEEAAPVPEGQVPMEHQLHPHPHPRLEAHPQPQPQSLAAKPQAHPQTLEQSPEEPQVHVGPVPIVDEQQPPSPPPSQPPPPAIAPVHPHGGAVSTAADEIILEKEKDSLGPWENFVRRARINGVSLASLLYLNEEHFAALMDELGVSAEERGRVSAERHRRIYGATHFEFVRSRHPIAAAAIQDLLVSSGLSEVQCIVHSVMLVQNGLHEKVFLQRLSEMSGRSRRVQHRDTSDEHQQQHGDYSPLITKSYALGDPSKTMEAVYFGFQGAPISFFKRILTLPQTAAGGSGSGSGGLLLQQDTSDGDMSGWGTSPKEDSSGQQQLRKFSRAVLLCDILAGQCLETSTDAPSTSAELQGKFDSVRARHGEEDEALVVYSPQQILPRVLLWVTFDLDAISCVDHPDTPAVNKTTVGPSSYYCAKEPPLCAPCFAHYIRFGRRRMASAATSGFAFSQAEPGFGGHPHLHPAGGGLPHHAVLRDSRERMDHGDADDADALVDYEELMRAHGGRQASPSVPIRSRYNPSALSSAPAITASFSSPGRTAAATTPGASGAGRGSRGGGGGATTANEILERTQLVHEDGNDDVDDDVELEEVLLSLKPPRGGKSSSSTTTISGGGTSTKEFSPTKKNIFKKPTFSAPVSALWSGVSTAPPVERKKTSYHGHRPGSENNGGGGSFMEPALHEEEHPPPAPVPALKLQRMQASRAARVLRKELVEADDEVKGHLGPRSLLLQPHNNSEEEGVSLSIADETAMSIGLSEGSPPLASAPTQHQNSAAVDPVLERIEHGHIPSEEDNGSMKQEMSVEPAGSHPPTAPASGGSIDSRVDTGTGTRRVPTTKPTAANNSTTTTGANIAGMALYDEAEEMAREQIVLGWRKLRSGQLDAASLTWLSVAQRFRGTGAAEEASGINAEVIERNAEKALQYYHRGAKRNPGCSSLHFRLGHLLETRYHDYDAALSAFEQAARLGDDAAVRRVEVVRQKRKSM